MYIASLFFLSTEFSDKRCLLKAACLFLLRQSPSSEVSVSGHSDLGMYLKEVD